MALVLLSSPAVAIRTRRVAEGHPIEKVIEMLKGLITQVDEESKAEALTYEKFEYWCKNSDKELSEAIAEGKSTIDELSSKIAGLKETEKVLTEEIELLKQELEKLDEEALEAKNIRKAESDLYAEADTDYKSTIKAIDDAIKLLDSRKRKQNRHF